MDVKELNKSQLILLAILLSFITSIATGIVTVTLMQQAPVSITTPINRVVQQTVEKITQIEGKPTVQTVVVKEEDLVVAAIAQNQPAIFTIFKNGYDSMGQPTEIPTGRGFVVSNDDIVVADASQVPDASGTYFVKNSSGEFKATFISTDKSGFTLLKIGDPVDGKSKLAYTLPTFGDLNKLKAGQKILVIGDAISSFIYDDGTTLPIDAIKGNAGGLVSDLDGNVLGISLDNTTQSFVSIGDIMKVVNPPSGTPKP